MYEAIMNSHRKWVFCITFIKLYCLQGVAMLFSFEKRFSPDNAKFTTLSYFCNKPPYLRYIRNVLYLSSFDRAKYYKGM